MTKIGLKIAKLFGKKLPGFATQAEAEKSLFQFRDNRLRTLDLLASKSEIFAPDGTAERLKRIEAWYFELWNVDGFADIGTSRSEFEECMAIYFGDVVVNNRTTAEWIVSEFAFEAGKYELGVEDGLVSIMLGRFTDHYETPNNKRRQSIFREYKKYFGAS